MGCTVLLLSSVVAALLLASGVALVAPVESTQAQDAGTATEPPVLIGMWGDYGSADGEFEGASGVATDSAGNVYVVDEYNHRIQKFDPEGNFVTKWGSLGVDDGEFYYPSGVATDPSDNVYVADDRNDRIQKFDSAGNFVTKWGSDSPESIATDSSGNVYVGDYSRVKKFNSNGTFISQFGSYGSGDGQFEDVSGVATDSSSNVYVVDYYNHRVQKFGSNGTFVTKWGELGIEDGEFYYPSGIATDSSGNVYVADSDNGRIQKFGSDGTFITKWDVRDSYGDLDYLYAVDVDSSGNVYVAGYDTIYKYGLDNGAPKVSTTKPASGKTGVRRDTNITATFSEQMDSSTLTDWDSAAVKIVKASTGTAVSLDDVSCDNPCRTVTIDPYSRLAKNTKYKAIITTKAKDLSGKALTKNYVWTFTTGRR